MSKIAHFLYSLLIAAKNQSQFGQRFCLASSENFMGFLDSELLLARCQSWGLGNFLQTQQRQIWAIFWISIKNLK